jgi:hypothetical protein
VCHTRRPKSSTEHSLDQACIARQTCAKPCSTATDQKEASFFKYQSTSEILKQNDPLMTTWQYHGFDSACAPTGPFGGSLEETCIKDPKRIKILQAIPGVTTKLEGAGYTIAGGKIVKRDGGGFGQPPAQSYAPHQAVVAAPKSAAAPKAAVKQAAALKEVKATVGAGSLPAASSSPSQPPPLSKGPSTIQNEKKILTAAKMATLRSF